jgi:integrase
LRDYDAHFAAVVARVRLWCATPAAIQQEDFQKLVQAALLTGCRYSELARVKCSDFNRDSDTLAVRLSKGKVRHVVLTDEAKAAF